MPYQLSGAYGGAEDKLVVDVIEIGSVRGVYVVGECLVPDLRYPSAFSFATGDFD